MNYVLVLTLALTFGFDTITSQEALSNECQDSFRNAALTAHNKFRAKHSASALKGDTNIEATALRWSNEMASSGNLGHSQTQNLGENVYMSWGQSFSSSSECASKQIFLFRNFKIIS